MKILMVDDVNFSLEMGKIALSDSGCEILTAINGKEAWELIQKEQPDLILTDLFMPEMNGDELCQKIKESQSFSHIPVVIITSVDDKNNVDKCKAAGCDQILKKPYAKSDLINIVNGYVNIICRKYERFPVDFEVAYNVDGQICSGKVVDISEGGMFVKGQQPIPIGADAEFSISSGCDSSNHEFAGKVVRIVPGDGDFSFDNVPGMGVEFEENFCNLESIIA